MADKMVKVYSTPTCPWCRRTKQFLENNGIKYQDMNVADDKAAREEMINVTHQMSVPTIMIDGEIVIGFKEGRAQRKIGNKIMYELIIIGGGPAGMTAAVYAARKKINALMLAKDIGGQVMWTSTIENYMGYQLVEGIELMDKFEQQLKQFPIERKDGEEVILRQARIPAGFEVVTRIRSEI